MDSLQNFFISKFEIIADFINEHPTTSQEAVVAKKEYIQQTGVIREADDSYENRMNSFLLWFAFDWKIAREGDRTPYQLFLMILEEKRDVTDEEIQFFTSMYPHQHSLFELKKFTKTESVLKDLFTGTKYVVPDVHSLIGLDKGTFFETRLFEFQQGKCFAHYCIPHPMDVRRNITRQIKLIKKRPQLNTKLVLKLHHFYTKWISYRNIDMRSVYHFDRKYPAVK
ncbi:MAG: hypothetical protein ACI86H_000814 [bacterium]|jgi:hypothetical protein